MAKLEMAAKDKIVDVWKQAIEQSPRKADDVRITSQLVFQIPAPNAGATVRTEREFQPEHQYLVAES